MTAIASQPKRQPTSLVPKTDMDQITKLDETSRAASEQLLEAEVSGNSMAKMLITARAIKTLRGLLSANVMADIMELMNTPLGFKTDKDPARPVKNRNGNYESPQPYSADVVRDVMIQALIRGLRPTGNEINIIAGNLYVTREGFERLLREFPGLSNLKVQVGVPVTQGEGALVSCRASWQFNGTADEIVCEKQPEADYRIPIRVNAAMGVDAIQGKAKSKLYRRIYERLTGTTIQTEADAADEPAKPGAKAEASDESQASDPQDA